MYNPKKYLGFIEFSIIVFLVYGIIIGFSIGARNTQDSKNIYQYIQDWKELIGAGVALFGAWIAFRATTTQTLSAHEQAQDQIRRENLASRAVLPLALSELCSYSEECLIMIGKLDDQILSGKPISLTIPRVSTSTTDILRENIRTATDPEIQKISKLISEIQILTSRLEGDIKNRSSFFGEMERKYREYQCIEIYTIASDLFKYGRMDTLFSSKSASPENSLGILSKHVKSEEDVLHIIKSMGRHET